MDRPRLKVDIRPQAQREIEEIARVHLSLSGPSSARRVTDGIYDAIEQLMTYPLSGPVVPYEPIRQMGYRYILAGKYLVFYRVMGDTIVVYHVVHGATDYPKLFKGF